MNKYENTKTPLKVLTALTLAALVTGCGGGGSSVLGTNDPAANSVVCSGAACVDLGTAANYVIFSDSAIATVANPSVITGNIALGPGVTSTAFTAEVPISNPRSRLVFQAIVYRDSTLPWQGVKRGRNPRIDSIRLLIIRMAPG